MDSRDSVLFLLSSLAVGGSERKTVRLANALAKNGWDVHVVYIDSTDLSPRPLHSMVDKRVKVYGLGRKRRYSLLAAIRLYRYAKAYQIKRVVSVNLYPLAYAVPVILGFRRKAPKRLISLVNTTVFVNVRGDRFMHLYSSLLRYVDKIVFGCKFQKNMWVSRYFLDSRKCTHIYNGVDLRQFPTCEEREDIRRESQERSADRRLVIGTVGQLRTEKNQAELIVATEQLVRAGYDIRVLIIGDGPERARLDELVHSLELRESVEMWGQVEDVRPGLSQMDVFVLPSRSETFSNAALEAMAMGCAIVMSRVGGASEMVVEGYNGHLYESGRIEELVDILGRLIVDPVELRRLGANARSLVSERFQFDTMVRDFENALAD